MARLFASFSAGAASYYLYTQSLQHSTGVRESASKTFSSPKDLNRHSPQAFLKRVTLKPFGVLGQQLTSEGKVNQICDRPGEDTAVVDPAGLPYVSGEKRPGQAGAASRSIYVWCGLEAQEAFPKDVKDTITEPGKAKFHSYEVGGSRSRRNAIHVVGPDFRQRPYSDLEAINTLSDTYANVLREVALTPASIRTIRMLPISGGVFLGDFKSDLTHMTICALKNGFERLSPEEQGRVLEKDVQMCIFLASELPTFERAHTFAIAEP